MRLSLLDPEKIRSYTSHNRRPRRSGQRYRIVGVFVSRIVFSMFLFGCLPNTQPTTELVQPTTTSPSTSTPEVLLGTVLPTPTAPNLPTHTPISCLTQDGTIEVHDIQHPAFVSPVRVRVYLPPCYEQDTFATYPTLILLHGLLATDEQWDDLGVDELANELIQSGKSPPFIVLMPWIRNSQDPQIAVIEALIPYAQGQWRITNEREFWAIGGISRGAGQAMQIGLLHPDQFRAIGLHSPATLHVPELLLGWYLAIEEAQRPAIWFDMGEYDSLLQSATVLLETFQDAGITLTQQTSPGDHTSDYWRKNLPAYISWYRSFWLATIAEAD
jgi:enterochelin esterase-like enzyme